jgi:glycosyltransferase involved in cell wall biosynthesis
MIVRNESARIVRAIQSVAPYISCYAITDTGSTDNTVEIIQKYFADLEIPGEISSCEFVDWSQARNFALARARFLPIQYDYILLMDADMELKVLNKGFNNGLIGRSYDMFQQGGSLKYINRRLVRRDQTGVYMGVTHEYLDVVGDACVPAEHAYFLDHADGANRPEKFKRDIRLLEKALIAEPNNGRYFYYLAQSYRDAGKPANAAKWYKKRVDLGGWDEETWSAQQNYAQCLLELKDEAGFVLNMQLAYNMRPSRAETLYDLAHFYREKGMNAASVLFSEAGLQIPYSQDALFVSDFVYTSGLMEEFSICAFYLPDKRARGFDLTNKLALKKGPYGHQRETARNNLYHYLPVLKDIVSTFEWQKIDFTAPTGYTAMNPSVAAHRNRLYTIVRTVNYKIVDGRYEILGTDGTANDSNPIRTRNFLLGIDAHLKTTDARELLPPGNMPEPLFKAVLGFEDMRLFSSGYDLNISACVREMNADGYCEQVYARIDGHFLTNVTRMLRTPREYEKNWMPIVNGPDARYMYRLGEVVDHTGKTVEKTEPEQDCRHMSGGSQLIPHQGGWLCLVHEARFIPGTQLRYYQHRFVTFDSYFAVRRITKPFVLHEKQIEFVAGAVWHPVYPKLVISYGYQDKEARLATIDMDQLERFLWQS